MMLASLVWSPPFAWPAVGAVVAIAALFPAYRLFAAARATGAHGPAIAAGAIRLAAVGAIGAALAGPSIRATADRPPDAPAIALLVDRSRSMCIADVESGDSSLTRHEAIERRWLTRETLQAIHGAAPVRLYSIGAELAPLTLTEATSAPPDASRTRLAHAVNALLASGAPLRGIVILTDGADTDDLSGGLFRAAAERARAAGVRLHAVPVGADRRPPDISIDASFDHAAVLAGEPTTLRIRVHGHGFTGAASALVVEERTPTGVREVMRRALAISEDTRLEVPVTPPADAVPGGALTTVEYIASIEPVAGEADHTNNASSAIVQVIGAPIRIVLFENQPFWETRAFIDLLRTDPQVDLTVVSGLGAARERIARYRPASLEHTRANDANTPTAVAPTEEPDLSAFDIVVLGRGVERWFGAERADVLLRFVIERGGAIILLRGDPVGDASTPDGLALQAVIDELAGPASTGVVAPDVDTADESGAAGAIRAVGRGRTLALPQAAAWRRWLTAAPDDVDRDRLASEWSRMVRALALGAEIPPGQDLTLTVDRTQARPGEAITFEMRSRRPLEAAAAPIVHVRAASGATHEVALHRSTERGGAFVGTVMLESPGAYEARVGLPEPALEPDPVAPPPIATTRFIVREGRLELLDSAARPALLAAAAERTGGLVLTPDEPGPFIESLRATAGPARETRQDDRLEPAWDRPWVFGAIALLLLTEWTARRWRGLP